MENYVTSTAHTAGPWTYELDESTGYFRIDSETSEYPSVADVFYRETDEEGEANARLIAAAPELLDALDELLSQTVDRDLAFGIELTEGEQEARQRALAAIEKACG